MTVFSDELEVEDLLDFGLFSISSSVMTAASADVTELEDDFFFKGDGRAAAAADFLAGLENTLLAGDDDSDDPEVVVIVVTGFLAVPGDLEGDFLWVPGDLDEEPGFLGGLGELVGLNELINSLYCFLANLLCLCMFIRVLKSRTSDPVERAGGRGSTTTGVGILDPC